MNRTNDNRPREDESSDAWKYGAAIGVGAAVAGGLWYLLSGKKEEKKEPTRNVPPSRQLSSPSSSTNRGNGAHYQSEQTSVSSYLSDLITRVSTQDDSRCNLSRGVTVTEVTSPSFQPVTNLNSLLSDIHVRYIKLKEFELHYKVFDTIFQHLHKKMKEVDPYYRKYSSTVQFAGSHYDNLRIKKPDEFDMDIVISLPLDIKVNRFNSNESDMVIEPKSAGFLQLRMGTQFQKLPMRDNEEWQINKAAYLWKDDSSYLLRSKFTDWFKSVVNKALNTFEVNANRPLFYVDGVPYIIDKSESGPAFTLLIKNPSRNFSLDVDLVPALKLPEDRWPINSSYREIPPKCRKGYWMVVGKPNKSSPFQHDQDRSWRIALHNQEREFMYNSHNLRQGIRFIKMLRDTLGMDKIASYYIKTIFYWEIDSINDQLFWQRNNPATIFKLMVRRLHDAIVLGKIPYFWNKRNNLIENVDKKTLESYAAKLSSFLEILDQPSNYKLVAKYLLTPGQFAEYNATVLHI